MTKYSPINRKEEEIVEYVKKYNHCIFDSESLGNFFDKVRNKSVQLDNNNKRSLPMVVAYEYHFFNYDFGPSARLRIYPKNHPEKTFLWMDFAMAKKIIRYKKEFDLMK
jgi:hypothetical protein